ncbi:MAG: hypothetical protein ACPGTU_12485 [Myxococcota bacterium]
MRILIAWISLLTAGCGSTGSKEIADTGESFSTCPPDYDQVECCDTMLGEISTCCCYQEECEEVMDFQRNDDGSCEEIVVSQWP